jgi:cellulose synthase/poly-beta-1,6-N-acetylglucosamine synthase-like glycosyltransferase
VAGPARTLVVIPAYNEEQSLPGVLKELAEQTPEYDVLVVSDGSVDRTAEVARAAGVFVAELPFNLGIGGAIRTGFKFAVARNYEQAVQFDADGQHDPLAVSRLLAPLDDGADMVIGSRFAAGGAVTYEVSGSGAPQCSSCAGSCAGSCVRTSATPAPASARSRDRCSSSSPSPIRSNTWTRSKRS